MTRSSLKKHMTHHPSLILKKKQFNCWSSSVFLYLHRAIFRWMTTKNMYTVMFDSELPGSPEQIIAGFKDGKTTYARIFECLCKCVTMP